MPAQSREQIVAFQTRRLRSVVTSAYRRVPYYRRLFDHAGLRPEDIQSIEDLAKIPLTSRNDIQHLRPPDLCARGVAPDSLLQRRTSGSTGMPLTIRRHWLEERLLLACRLRGRCSWAEIWKLRRATIKFIPATEKARQSAPSVLQRLALPRAVIDWKLPKEEIVRRLREIRPTVISGPPGILSWLADELTGADRAVLQAGLVVTGGETLTAGMRKQIERGFGAPVRDSYGSHEFVTIARECPDGGAYHVCDESLIVEVLRDGEPVEPGQDGELVGTALNSYAMPFLRYRLGDWVTRGPDSCPCGSPYSTLLRIQGRVIDRFTLANGKVVHPYELANVLRDHELWLRRFQIIQEQRDRFRIRVVPYQQPTGQEMQQAAAKIEARIGNGVTVELELVERLPPMESGKFYPYVSLERLNAWRQGEASMPQV